MVTISLIKEIVEDCKKKQRQRQNIYTIGAGRKEREKHN